jgi:GT2 family glycosyltransferase
LPRRYPLHESDGVAMALGISKSVATCPPPLVAVIILNWNSDGLTTETLESIRDQRYTNLVTIVVDNASANQAEFLAHLGQVFPKVRTIATNRNLGYAGGNNLGIRLGLELGADYLMLLNNDVLLDPMAITELVRAAEADPGAGAVGPLIFYASQPGRVWFGGGTMAMGRRVLARHDGIGQPSWFAADAASRPTDWLPGTAILAHREVVKQAGLLDPRYFLYWEDVDWCYTLRHAGYRLLLVPRSHVWHKVNASTGRLPLATTYYWERNRLRFIERWGTWEARLFAWGKIFWRLIAWRVVPPQDDPTIRVKLRAYRDYLRRRFGEWEGLAD